MEKVIKYFEDNSIEYDKSKVYLNRIDFSSFNVINFNKEYSITILKYNGDKEYIDFNSIIFDKLSKESKIESVSFSGGSWVYILTKKSEELDLDAFLDKLEKCSEYKKNEFTYQNMTVSQSDLNFKISKSDKPIDFTCPKKDKMDTVYNLLFNALARKYDELSNLEAQLYIHIPKREKEIRTLNISVERGLLGYKVQSFVLYKDKLKSVGSNSLKIENLKKAPKYIIKYGENNSIKIERCYDTNEKKLYVKGSIKKRVIKYDNLELNKTEKTKLDTIFELIDDFNSEYKSICRLEFLKQDLLFVEMKSKQRKCFIERIESDYRSLEKVTIIPAADIQIDNPLVQKLYADFKLLDYGIDFNISNEFDKNSLNIVIHHDREYYEKLKQDDIKLTFPIDVIYQGITIESLDSMSSFKDIAKKVLSELFIKRELFARKINNWKFGEMEFYLGIKSIDKKNSTKLKKVYRTNHCLMKINSDGYFEITNNPDEIDVSYTKLVHNIKKSNDNDKTGNICLVKMGDNINLIEHTDYILIPNKETFENEIKESIENSLKSRSRCGEKFKDKTLFPYVDKLIFELNGELYYSLGLNRGFDTKVTYLNNIYKVYVPDDSEIIPEIFDMLENIHVRSNSTESVRPYPFKHLSEYIRINNVGLDIRII